MLELNLLFRNQRFVPACYNKSDSKICFQLAIMNQIRSFFYSILVSFPQSKLRFAEPKLCFQPFITTGVGNFISNLFLQHKFKVLFPRSKFLSAIKTLSQPAVTIQIWSFYSVLSLQLKFEACFPGSKLHFLNRRFLGEAKLLIINEIWSFVSRINVSFSES